MATALLFNFTDAQKLQKVRFALFKLGIAGCVVDAADFLQLLCVGEVKNQCRRHDLAPFR